LVFVRELAGGIYYGASEEDAGSGRAANTMEYTAAEVRRIAKVAFELAASRRGEVVSIDKANVLAVSRLWRSVVDEVAKSYPKVVLLTPNLFGDILSDEAASLAGSIGLLSSASIGGHTDLYEPVHGSAPDIAGTDWVNPIGMIASIALMLRHSYGLRQEAETVEGAVEVVLAAGYRTADIRSDSGKCVGTQEFARLTADACATVATGDSDDIHTAVSAFSRPNEDD
jgi:3-isopropylmalate dehydrogenase